eukprot:scaffold1640_cov161-Amphora_coffeaeformis.AAC.2
MEEDQGVSTSCRNSTLSVATTGLGTLTFKEVGIGSRSVERVYETTTEINDPSFIHSSLLYSYYPKKKLQLSRRTLPSQSSDLKFALVAISRAKIYSKFYNNISQDLPARLIMTNDEEHRMCSSKRRKCGIVLYHTPKHATPYSNTTIPHHTNSKSSLPQNR